MAAITITGIMDGDKTSIKCEKKDDTITAYFDGIQNDSLLDMLLLIMKPMIIGGTYYPTGKELFEYLQPMRSLFDTITDEQIEGDIGMMPDEELVY